MATMPAAPSRCVSYQLLIRVARRVRVRVGRLGTFDFPRGNYVYTGSARRNLEARIARHLSSEKTLRWHVDYLLASGGVAVVGVLRSPDPECELNQRVGGQVVVPGFGASDCACGCGSHLRRLAGAFPAGPTPTGGATRREDVRRHRPPPVSGPPTVRRQNR